MAQHSAGNTLIGVSYSFFLLRWIQIWKKCYKVQMGKIYNEKNF